MTYLDTGCLVKLYYPEPDSGRVIAAIRGKPVFYTPLHALEFVNALHLKLFRTGAQGTQVAGARALVEADLKTGILLTASAVWQDLFDEAVSLAERHTGTLGCRSLDILHCAMAKLLAAKEFVTTDARQKQLASAMGLNVVNI